MISRNSRSQIIAVPNAQIKNVMNMIRDPCDGPMCESGYLQTGSGLYFRQRSTISVAIAQANGYIVWYPSYHNVGSGAVNTPFNVFAFEAAATSSAPTNTVASNMGSAAIGALAGVAYPDPSYSILNGGTYVDARTLSACMKIEYTGGLSVNAGFTAVSANFPLRNMFSGTGVNGMLKIDDVFNFALDRHRTDVDAREIVWRPQDLDATFRMSGTAANSANNADDCILMGNNATVQTISEAVDPGTVGGLIFAYKGVPTGTMTITLTKVVEVRLAPSTYAIETSPVNVSKATPTTTVGKIVQMLDKRYPDWQNHLVSMATSATAAIARMALSGSA